MTEVISVRFRGGCKNYYFDPKGQQVKMGDQVIVETAQGPEFATCTEGNHEVEDASIVKPLCAVLRPATESDLRTLEYNKKREHEAFDICERKIAEHGLEMKLVNVSCNFDGNKIIFFFTADGRVDFRELVRDLASVFRARIELRQIGVRDEAKMVGGLGICGQPFCCSRFLDGFLPVSIKMAKTQNLSLNPAKISGTCGRLMCCLKYEQDAYEDAARRMPKAESFVQTPDGPGNVKSVDLLRERVKVSLDASPEGPKCYHNCEVCVLRNGKGSREGIQIPAERPARYVEVREPEPEMMPTPVLTRFAAEADREEEKLPQREKVVPPEGERSRRSRSHRGGRGRKSGTAAGAPMAAPAVGAKPEKQQPRGGKPERPGEKPKVLPKAPSKTPPKPSSAAAAPAPAAPAPAAQDGDTPRKRPHHRGGRRRGHGGGSAAAPTEE